MPRRMVAHLNSADETPARGNDLKNGLLAASRHSSARLFARNVCTAVRNKPLPPLTMKERHISMIDVGTDLGTPYRDAELAVRWLS
jgi:hypothetical protein